MSAVAGLDTHTKTVADVVAKVPTELIIGGVSRRATACIDAASAAAGSWAATAPRRRSEILQRTYQLMVERVDELALLITAENGKALPDARGEVLYSAEFFRWYAEEAVRIRGDIQVAPGPSSWRTAPSTGSSR